MPVTSEMIDNYFKQYGWRYQQIDEQNWQTGCRGDVASYTIRIRANEKWIYFSIVPFAIAPKKELWPRLHFYLLRANQEMNVAKFYLDADTDIVLAVELPADSLDYSEFERALNALSWYADEHYLAVLNLAQNVGAPSKYEQGGEAPEAAPEPAAGGGELDWGDETPPSGQTS